jgi:hypothetical protein
MFLGKCQHSHGWLKVNRNRTVPPADTRDLTVQKGAPDDHVLSVVAREGRVLVSLARDFANIVRHAPDLSAVRNLSV